MSDDEIITVVQAHKEGKRIQSRHIGTTDDFWWCYCPVEFQWNFGVYEYRIAPEPRKPREWVMGVDQWGRLVSETYGQVGGAIRVREVIE